MPSFDAAVVGGGVVGVAVSVALARTGARVVLVERHARLGSETSSRNSGVVHAGLYYPNGSTKARTCLRGRELLYARCAERGIPHRKTGKLVVASGPERAALEALKANAERNGATGLALLDRDAVRRREPHLLADAALVSAESGIVDAHALVDDLRREALAHDVVFAMRTRFVAAAPIAGGYELVLEGPDGTTPIDAGEVVNAAGLDADRVSAAFGIDVDRLGLRLSPNKGDYFVLRPSAPRPSCPLVYPMPAGPGLGIHLTTDLAGVVRAGPDTEWVDVPRYDVDPGKRARFADAVRRYLPSLRDEDLEPDYAGVRPKLRRGESLGADFVVEECSALGLPGFVHLVGIESPGLTASLGLAEEVARALGRVP